jgi:hypothetical protein
LNVHREQKQNRAKMVFFSFSFFFFFVFLIHVLLSSKSVAVINKAWWTQRKMYLLYSYEYKPIDASLTKIALADPDFRGVNNNNNNNNKPISWSYPCNWPINYDSD